MRHGLVCRVSAAKDSGEGYHGGHQQKKESCQNKDDGRKNESNRSFHDPVSVVGSDRSQRTYFADQFVAAVRDRANV